jgi:hypothetical protein
VTHVSTVKSQQLFVEEKFTYNNNLVWEAYWGLKDLEEGR